MHYIDTHTHVYDPDFRGDMLMVSTFMGKKNPLYDGDEDSVEYVARLVNQHANTYAILGIYPEFAHHLDIDNNIKGLRGIILANRDKVVAIGEIGLDYHCHPSKTDIVKQQQLFRAQLELAVSLNLPVALHIRDACENDQADAFYDIFQVLSDFPQIRGVCHSFTGNRTSLKKALALGLYVSVNGIYTFNKDPELQATLDSIPLNRLLLETDAPFLTPIPHRKERNKSSFIPAIAEFVAKSRGITLTEVATITTENAKQLFDI